jgi:hypothetical protein
MAPAARSGAFFLVSYAARQPARRSRKLTRRKPITAHHARPRGDLPSTFAVTDTPNREPSPHGEVTGRMPATVDAITDAERAPDDKTPTEKSAVTLDYEAMLAALNAVLAEMREEKGRPRHRAASLMPSMAGNLRPSKTAYGSKLTLRSPRNSHGCPPTRRTAPVQRICVRELNPFL